MTLKDQIARVYELAQPLLVDTSCAWWGDSELQLASEIIPNMVQIIRQLEAQLNIAREGLIAANTTCNNSDDRMALSPQEKLEKICKLTYDALYKLNGD